MEKKSGDGMEMSSNRLITRLPTSPVTYKLKDLSGDDIKGTFYSDELQIVEKPDDALFDVEHIVRTRKRAGKIE